MTGLRTSTGRWPVAALVALLIAGVTALLPARPAGAVQVPHDVVVSDNPANFTPHVLNGRVNAIAQVGNTVYLGGSFSQVREDDSTQVLARSNFLAFNATSGDISPLNPGFDGEVLAIVPAADGQSLYVGGRFDELNGQPSRSLARISTATGQPVPGFDVPTLTGSVRDLRLVGDRLWLAGGFTHVNGVQQSFLATIDADTGAFDPFMRLPIAGTHAGGFTQVLKIDVTPDRSRLFAIGNFTSVGGQSNDQIVALDLTGGSATLANWHTDFFEATCSSSFDSYMRDLDISPDGQYVVISTTGAYSGGPPRPCDTHSRFEVGAQGEVDPTWVHYTGGDTSYAVAVTGEAVYVGGHFRWGNNPNAGDRAGDGAVERSGLVALDPRSGVPLSWNPGRTLGVGVFDILSTPTGLWVASDTDRIGNFEFHGRIAFFPTAGGTPLPPDQPGVFPGRVHLLDPASGPNVQGRFFDGTGAGPLETFPDGGINWNAVTAAVMIDDTVYAGFDNESFLAFTFDGQSWGPADPVDTADQLNRDDAWHNDVENLTGLFFDDGRLYYTVAGSSSLFARGFSTESQIVGAERLRVSGSVAGIDFSDVRGMFLGGGHLYWASSNGTLHRIQFTDGRPVGGTAEVVSGPGVDGVDWRASALFLSTEIVAGGPNQPPVADAQVTCSGLSCTADGTGSTDPDGTIATYSWNFGDNTPAQAGPTATHTYSQPGTYTITLTVTDDDGATGSATEQVTVEEVAGDISFVGAASANLNGTSHTIAVPPGVQAGDTLLLFASNNNVATTVSTPAGAASWTQLDTAGTSSMDTTAWVATATSAGGQVTVTTSEFAKVGLTLLAYRGAATNPVAAVAAAAETATTATHTTPTVTAAGGGQWLVSYWAHKDSTSTALTPEAEVTTRTSGVGSGGGRILAAAADSGGPVAGGTAGGHTATATATSRHATAWSILLTPADGTTPTNQPPVADAQVTCSGLSCTANGTGSTDPDGTIAAYSWNFGDNTPAQAGATTTHTYSQPGTYTITLTVTDDDGATDSTTEQVTVAEQGNGAVTFVGADATNANATTHAVELPAGVQPGDTLLLFAANNNVAANLSMPTGGGSWTQLGTIGTDSMTTTVWAATATGAAGTDVTLTTPAFAKVGLTLLAYRGTAAMPIAALESAAETATTAAHTTPTVTGVLPGDWVVSLWAQKDSSSTGLTPAAGLAVRSTTVGSGGGRILTAAADSGGPVAGGTAGGLTASATAASRHAAMWTIVLRPA